MVGQSRKVLQGGLLGQVAWPKPASDEHLHLLVVDQGGVVVNSVQMHIRPAWFGEDWHEHANLQAAFVQLAQALTTPV